MNPELDHLKDWIEGKPGLPRWNVWVAEQKPQLLAILTPGQYLRLKFEPLDEIPKILNEQGIAFTESDYYDWPGWDQEGPVGLPRILPSAKHVELVLATFRLGPIAALAREFGGGEPRRIYVTHVEAQRNGRTLNAWMLENNKMKPASVENPPPPLPEEQFFTTSRASFVFTPDCRKVLISLSAGRLCGNSAVHGIETSRSGSLKLGQGRILSMA